MSDDPTPDVAAPRVAPSEPRRERPTASSDRRHSAEFGQWYERVLTGRAVGGRLLEVRDGGPTHVLEKGVGPPLVLLHGTGLAAGFLLPLLDELDGVQALAPDLPGSGLSEPIDFSRKRYHATTIAWLDHLLDALELDTTSLFGHSAGGTWALRYALARPERVDRLVLSGPPALPKTRCPLPYRLLATPGLGAVLARVPPSRKSVLRLAEFMGERETLADRPELVDLFLVAGRDPLAATALRAEARALISPFALLMRSGWRRRSRVRSEDLRRLAVPTLLIWGDREPLGSVAVAREIAGLMPNGRLQVLPAGHGPWLGQPKETAAAVMAFVRSSSSSASRA